MKQTNGGVKEKAQETHIRHGDMHIHRHSNPLKTQNQMPSLIYLYILIYILIFNLQVLVSWR